MIIFSFSVCHLMVFFFFLSEFTPVSGLSCPGIFVRVQTCIIKLNFSLFFRNWIIAGSKRNSTVISMTNNPSVLKNFLTCGDLNIDSFSARFYLFCLFYGKRETIKTKCRYSIS